MALLLRSGCCAVVKVERCTWRAAVGTAGCRAGLHPCLCAALVLPTNPDYLPYVSCLPFPWKFDCRALMCALTSGCAAASTPRATPAGARPGCHPRVGSAYGAAGALVQMLQLGSALWVYWGPAAQCRLAVPLPVACPSRPTTEHARATQVEWNLYMAARGGPPAIRAGECALLCLMLLAGRAAVGFAPMSSAFGGLHMPRQVRGG